MKDIEKYKIITIQAQTIYDRDNIASINNLPKGIIIRDENNNIDFSKFNGYLDRSLETEQLEKVYKKTLPKDDKFCITKKHGDFEDNYTTAIIGLLFKYAHHEYNSQKTINGYMYVKDGYMVNSNELVNHVLVKDNVLIAIEVPFNPFKLEFYDKVTSPISEDLLGKYFTYNKMCKCYELHKEENGKDVPIKVIKTTEELREYVYKNGFYCDGKHYVRYKRSAGSSREGHCLFIQEALLEEMMQWTECGIDKSKITDLASWEAYISLTLSNMQSEVTIPHKAILVVRDQYSIFNDKVISVFNNEKGELEAKELNSCIANNIWDGEALLDESVFNECGYQEKGMMLLRNKFFKSCAFNCKIQKWFEDNNITKISELNGYTKARDVKDIKLIVTESSIKYLKLNGINKYSTKKEFNQVVDNWIKQIGTTFGVVKTDKKTSFFNGDMVQTSYQIINTLNMTDEEVLGFLNQTIDYLHKIRGESKYMRYYLKARLDEKVPEDIESQLFENEDCINHLTNEELNVINSRFKSVLGMMVRSEDFTHTQIYKDLRKDITSQIKEKIKQGRVLINGTYATILGNGAELLKFAISKDNKVFIPELAEGEIYINRFEDNKKLFCARSPHITMGNILLATNKHNEFYDKYFNLSPEIVCVNAINFNLQQRLNGCDYDSDTMLITNNKYMLASAERYYDKFLVPTCDIQSIVRARRNNNIEKVGLDQKISNNSIGEIVNLSQYLNSILWHKINSGESEEDWKELYLDICKLAVLSGIEIDSAKKQYDIQKNVELNNLKKKKQQYIEKYGIPKFFSHIRGDDKKKKAKGVVAENDVVIESADFSVLDENTAPFEYAYEYDNEYDYEEEELDADDEYGYDFGDDDYSNFDNEVTTSKAERSKHILVKKEENENTILTNMENVYKIVGNTRGKPRAFNVKLASLLDPTKITTGENDYKYKRDCLKLTEEVARPLSKLNKQIRVETGDKSFLVEEKARLLTHYHKELSKKLKTGKVIKMLLEKIEEVTTDEKGREEKYKYRSLLFTAICCDPEEKFYNMLKPNKGNVLQLIPIQLGKTEDRIYDYYYISVPVHKSVQNTED